MALVSKNAVLSGIPVLSDQIIQIYARLRQPFAPERLREGVIAFRGRSAAGQDEFHQLCFFIIVR